MVSLDGHGDGGLLQRTRWRRVDTGPAREQRRAALVSQGETHGLAGVSFSPLQGLQRGRQGRNAHRPYHRSGQHEWRYTFRSGGCQTSSRRVVEPEHRHHAHGHALRPANGHVQNHGDFIRLCAAIGRHAGVRHRPADGRRARANRSNFAPVVFPARHLPRWARPCWTTRKSNH